MAYFNIPNVKIKGIAACVPSKVEEIKDYPLFNESEVSRMLPFFGLARHHVVQGNQSCSDLCKIAAEKLLNEVGWSKDSVDIIIYSAPGPDYIFPATACVLHNEMGFRQDCCAFDVPYGCPGWVYGLTIIGNMISSGTIRRGLLMVGDLPSRFGSKQDKSTYPFFGDAGTATLIEYDKGAFGFRAEIGTMEKGWEKIMVPHGGLRHPTTSESLLLKEEQSGVSRTMLNTHMEGMDVFSMSTKQDPITIGNLLEKSGIALSDIDIFAFHQTNKFLMDRVIKKMKIDATKVPTSLEEYANTGGASCPLTLVSERQSELRDKPQRVVACALGVGISYGAVYFETERLVVPDMLTL